MKNYKQRLTTLTLIALVAMTLQSCSNGADDSDLTPAPLKAIVLNGSLEEDQAKLDALLAQITQLAESIPCSDPSEWKITPYGQKACGGPISYLAYHTAIDEAKLLDMVEVHRLSQNYFNEKWSIVSTCDFETPPNSLECRDNRPFLIF
jgi:hypothetical protein